VYFYENICLLKGEFAKASRFMIKKDLIPGPGDYNTHKYLTLEEKLKLKMKLHSSVHSYEDLSMLSGSKQLLENKQNPPSPGPGDYNSFKGSFDFRGPKFNAVFLIFE